MIAKEPPLEALRRFNRWLNENYWAARGEVFDIGNTTADAFAGFMQHGIPHAPSGAESNGNGALMRIALVLRVFRLNGLLTWLESMIYLAHLKKYQHENFRSKRLFGWWNIGFDMQKRRSIC
jgi:ADP-ribosylglycohydrolase